MCVEFQPFQPSPVFARLPLGLRRDAEVGDRREQVVVERGEVLGRQRPGRQIAEHLAREPVRQRGQRRRRRSGRHRRRRGIGAGGAPRSKACVSARMAGAISAWTVGTDGGGTSGDGAGSTAATGRGGIAAATRRRTSRAAGSRWTGRRFTWEGYPRWCGSEWYGWVRCLRAPDGRPSASVERPVEEGRHLLARDRVGGAVEAGHAAARDAGAREAVDVRLVDGCPRRR